MLQTHLGGDLGSSLNKTLDDACVGVEEVIAGHARFSGHACWNDDEVSALKGCFQ